VKVWSSPTGTRAVAPSAPAVPDSDEETIAAAAEERYTIENGWLRAAFTNRGAQLVSIELLQRLDRDGVPLELVWSWDSLAIGVLPNFCRAYTSVLRG